MLPNLGELALAPSPTGVTVNPDGSATLTPDEWANLARLIGEPSAPPAAPLPARRHHHARHANHAHHARHARRVRRVRHDDDSSSSSSSEDERPLAARTRAPPAPPARPAPPAPPAHRRRKTAARPRPTVAHDDPDTLTDLLGADELAAILGAIGMVEESKASACADAKAWCALNKEHKAVCDSHPRVWQSLTERIFAIDDASLSHAAKVLGEGMIYRTFRDDANPQRAFERMCGAMGLADVLAKRFVIFAVEQYDEQLWDTWNDERAEITELGEAIEDLPVDDVEKLAKEYFPSLASTHEWESNAKRLFSSAPPKALYVDKYSNDPIFAKLVDVLFASTTKSLFEDQNLSTLDSTNRGNEPVLEAFYEIGELLGVYIVCLWQLQRDHDKFADNHLVDDDLMSDDEVEVLLDEMSTKIQDLRVQLVYAQDLVLNPAMAQENTNYDTYDTFQQEMYEYEYEHDDDAFGRHGEI